MIQLSVPQLKLVECKGTSFPNFTSSFQSKQLSLVQLVVHGTPCWRRLLWLLVAF